MLWRIIILLSLFPVLLQGQGLTFRHVTIADGLNNGTINSIQQDSLGRLWLATWDGLMQYDGYRVINHKPILGDESSLPSKKVVALSMDSRSNLWISTIGGLCCYNPTYDRFDRYSIAGLPPMAVRSAVIEYRDELLVRVNGNAYYLPSGKADSREFRSIRIIGAEDEIPDRFIRKIYPSENFLFRKSGLSYQSL